MVTGGSGFIGTAVVRDLLSSGATVCNTDINPPVLSEHLACWKQCDMMDQSLLRDTVSRFRPTHVVHLAAETEMKDSSREIVEDYPVNCLGIGVLVNALEGSAPAMSAIISTQYVCGPQKGLPNGDMDTFPHTRYGASKVALEQEVRTRYPFPWTILRPTYVWGPHNRKNFLELLQTLSHGKYLHPGGAPIVRSYGYVDTVSWMALGVLKRKDLSGRVLYATDPPEDSFAFVNRLSQALRGRSVHKVPRIVLRILSTIGDRTSLVPLNSFRYYNMTTSYLVPWKSTFDLVGSSPIDLHAAARETARWFTQDIVS